MKIKHLALTLTALLLGLAPRVTRAEDASFQVFYDTLSPLGEWVQVGDYGECWHPTGVDEDWAPYTDGYWSYTDAGWTWVSYEDWGGITYHYGRWVKTDEEGWCWVPDYEWGPAWVSWRNNDEAVGWAPLPPECHWRASVGISTWCDDTYDIGPGCYTFCPIVEFGAPWIRRVCYPRARNVFFIGSTLNCTNICFNSYHNVVFCGGPNFAFVSGHVHRPIPSLKLVLNANYNHNGHAWTNARNVGNTLQVYAPKIVNNNTTIINKPKITKVINKTQVNNGWAGVKDQAERQKIRAQIKEQNHGLTADTAPAKPVKPEDLKHVPEKADPNAPSPVAVTNGRGRDRDHDGIPDNRDPKIGNGNGPKVTGRDQNGDGIPDISGRNPKAIGKDQNGDGIPDNQPGKGAGNGNGPKVTGRDLNGDGIPDNPKGKGANNNGNGPKTIGRDLNGDGIPDNPQKNPGNIPKGVGRDDNGDGIPDNPNRHGGFQGPGDKPGKDAGNGALVPNGGRNNNGQIEKHNNRDAQEDAARRQAEAAERQRSAAAAAQMERERQAERQERAQRQAEAQQRAIENQRNQQIERQQEMQRERQQDIQRHQNQPQSQPQHQPQPQPQRQPQFQPQRQPQPQPQPQPNNGGGQGKGKQSNGDDSDPRKKHNN